MRAGETIEDHLFSFSWPRGRWREVLAGMEGAWVRKFCHRVEVREACPCPSLPLATPCMSPNPSYGHSTDIMTLLDQYPTYSVIYLFSFFKSTNVFNFNTFILCFFLNRKINICHKFKVTLQINEWEQSREVNVSQHMITFIKQADEQALKSITDV